MAQRVLLCPSAELDTRNQSGRDPGWLFVGFGYSVERGSGSCQFFQPATQLLQFFCVKSAANVPDESKFLAFIQSQEQGAKGQSSAARFGPATDNCIECLGYLQLDPVCAAVGNVRAGYSLRNDSFQAGFFGELEEFFSAFQLMIGVAKALGRLQQALQELLAFEQGRFAKIESVAVEKVEGVVNDGYLRNQILARSAHVHAFLQAFEVAMAAGIQSNDFSINNCLAGSEGFGKRSQFRVAPGDVRAGTGAKRQSAILNPG